LRLIVLIMEGQSTVLQIRSPPELILSWKFFRVTRATHVLSEPLINDNSKVVGCFGAMRRLAVSVGLRSLAAQDAGVICCGFLIDAFSLRLFVAEGVGVAEAEMSTTDGVGTAVSTALADAGAEDAESAEAPLGVAAEPLPVPPMIKVNANTKIVAAANTSPRRAQ
jgi:hypothetical protein